MSDAADRGLAYLGRFQTEAGSLRGDYDGPMFLLPGYVFAHYATGREIADRDALRAYIERAQNEDGGFGLHLEGPSSLFSTVLNYVALRLLGAEANEPARAWIERRGGAVGTASWGKYWLALLRLYEWEGVNPVLPELWLLPRRLPAHPRRMWCHARVVYLALSDLYGRRWQAPETPLLAQIREEIFAPLRYEEVDWRRARTTVDADDLYTPHSLLLRTIFAALSRVEPRIPRTVRARALAHTLAAVEDEQRATSYVDLGPVNKALDVVALHAAGSEHAEPAAQRLRDYLYEGERGLTMSAYNSSELWDTAFAVQAAVAAGGSPVVEPAVRFIAETQVREDPPGRDRDPSRGGWPFSTREHGWPIVDCTAEAMTALLQAGARPALAEAVDLILCWQNPDGGWPTYERRRASRFLELLNASELFADVMVDHSFVELKASAMHGLAIARAHLDLDRERVQRALDRGERFLRSRQRADGSWEGAWGICFSYGTWFGVRGLRANGAPADDDALVDAARFLLARQEADGGWGESWESCPRREYVPHPEGGQVVMTSWALLALLHVEAPGVRDAIERGVAFLLDRQLPDGDWPQASVTGVFNRTCMLHYRFYRNYFPIWALGAAERAGYAASRTRVSAA